MKKSVKKSVARPVPRLNSLLHRLQKAPEQEDESYLDQLMIFLEDPPHDVRNRWEKGAEMCAAWGVPTSGTSVWRLHCTYAITWRARLALEADRVADEEPEVLEEKAAKMIARRMREILADPQADPGKLIDLALLDLRRKTLELARRKYDDSRQTRIELAMKDIEGRVFGDFKAQFAFDRLRDELARINKARTISPLAFAWHPGHAYKIVSESYSPDSPYSPGSPPPPAPEP